MNLTRNRSVNSRLEALEREMSEHTQALVSMDMYLLMLETALLTAQVFTKEGLDALRTEVLRQAPKK